MRIAIAGLGFMGSTHVRALASVPGAVLAAVVSSDEMKLEGDLTTVGGNLGSGGEHFDFSAVRKYHDVSAALADSEIDAIDICLPSDQHYSAALAALQAGKHVLVEKPLALNATEAESLVQAARDSGRILMAGHVLRFLPQYAALADLLKRGHLGAVRSAFFRRRAAAPAWSRWLNDPSRSGGAVIDLLIHDIDCCLHLFGTPDAVSAVGAAYPDAGIDWMEARLEFPGRGPVIVTGGWHHPKSYPFSMEFTVVSELGTLEFRSGGADLSTAPLMLYDAAGSSETVVTETVDPFAAELSYFVECAAKGEWPALCPPEDSARAVQVARCLLESRENNGKRVECRV